MNYPTAMCVTSIRVAFWCYLIHFSNLLAPLSLASSLNILEISIKIHVHLARSSVLLLHYDPETSPLQIFTTRTRYSRSSHQNGQLSNFAPYSDACTKNPVKTNTPQKMISSLSVHRSCPQIKFVPNVQIRSPLSMMLMSPLQSFLNVCILKKSAQCITYCT